MTNKESLDNTGYIVSIKILDFEKRYKPRGKHYVYVMQITWTKPANVFIIYRRYAQFFDLQCKLLDLFAEMPLESNSTTQSRQIPFLPGKIILGRSQIRQIALERKQTLNEYCQNLITLPERISRSRPILGFFRPSSTDVQKPVEPMITEKKPVAINASVISGPSKLETYRCLDDFVSTDKTEMPLRRNTIVHVLEKQANGWWFVQNNDQTGFVPGTYLKPTDQQQGDREAKTFETSTNEIYIVNYTYEAKSPDEHSLDQGSFVTVIEKSFTGWWTIKFNDVTGQFPAIYLSLSHGRYTPENVSNGASSVCPPSIASKFLARESMQNSNDSDWDDDEEYHKESSNDTNPELYYAHSNFVDDVGDCLSFERGDLIEIHDKHPSGWWFGKRMKSGHVLTWIPANCLQKEPISDVPVDNTIDQSFNSEYYSNIPDIVRHPPVQQEQEKEKLPTEPIYQKFESEPSTDVIYAEVIKKPQPIVKIAVVKKASVPTPRPQITNEPDSTPKSVKDLVKRFNRL